MHTHPYNVIWDLEVQSIGMWTGDHHFSNTYTCQLVIDGITYRSVEHAYQAMKHPHLASIILEEVDPEKVPNILIDEPDPEGWDQQKLDVMYQLINAKVRQNKNVYKMLMASRGWLIYEDDPSDNTSFWGIAQNGMGENWVGRILMEIRYELQTESMYCSLLHDTKQLLPPSVTESSEKFLEFRRNMTIQRLRGLGIQFDESELSFELNKKLEEHFLAECITEFQLQGLTSEPLNTQWKAIVNSSGNNDAVLTQLSTILELNKFTATWEEVNMALQELLEQ